MLDNPVVLAALLGAGLCIATTVGTWTVAHTTRSALAHRFRAQIDAEAALVLSRIPPKAPGSRGIVMCAGGTYLSEAYASLRQVRKVGCTLPVDLVHVGPEEFPEAARRVFEQEIGNVRFVDAAAADLGVPPTNLKGFEIKSYALLLTRFDRVLFLDADSAPLRDPTPLLDAYDQLFWPDYSVSDALVRPAWACGHFADPIPPGPETESGQFVVHVNRYLHGLVYAWLLNKHQDVFYKHYYGDKDLFRLGFLMAGLPFRQAACMPGLVGNALPSGHPLLCAMVQHAPDGTPLFAHRTMHKRLRKDGKSPSWDLYVSNADEDGTRTCIRYVGHNRGTCLPGKTPVPGWPKTGKRIMDWQLAFESQVM
jgi:Mannosyltransferase putative